VNDLWLREMRINKKTALPAFDCSPVLDALEAISWNVSKRTL
jgi:hypothetical protein